MILYFVKKENGNGYDRNAVATYHEDLVGKCIIGHASLMVSEVFNKCLSLPHFPIKCKAVGKRINRGAGYGFEDPIDFTFYGNDSAIKWACFVHHFNYSGQKQYRKKHNEVIIVIQNYGYFSFFGFHLSVHEKCPNTEFFWSVFSRIWTEISVFSPNAGKYGPEKLHKVTIKNVNFFVRIVSCLRTHQRKILN